MTAIIGTLTFFTHDGATEIAALLSCTLQISTDELRAFDPEYVPDLQGWSASAKLLQALEADERPGSITELEQASIDRTLLDIRFTSLTGNEFAGKGYINRFQVTGADDSALTGNYNITGAGELVRT